MRDQVENPEGRLDETTDECPPHTAGDMDRGNALASHLIILGRNAKPCKDIEFHRSEDVNDTPIEVWGT